MKPQRRLKLGDKVPDFWTRDINGQEVNSRKFKKTTLIVFLRYAGCPFCNLAIYRLAHEHKLLKKSGCNVIAFVQSTEGNIEENIIQQQEMMPPFPIVSDQEQDVYRLFGVSPQPIQAVKYTAINAAHWIDAVFKKKFKQTSFDGNSFIVPAYFLVDKNGTIQVVNYDASFHDDSIFTPIYEHLTFGAA